MGFPYWSTGCRPPGPRIGWIIGSEPSLPALLFVLSDGFRWFSGVLSSDDRCFDSSNEAYSLSFIADDMVSFDMGGGDSALGNSVVTRASLGRFA
jgi:hypothetical protein